MSRAELAEAVNKYLWRTTGTRHALDAHAIARYERGKVSWPSAAYRAGLKAVLSADTDTDLGFRPSRRGSGMQRLSPEATGRAPLGPTPSRGPELLGAGDWIHAGCESKRTVVGVPNILLADLIDEAGISHSGLASKINEMVGTRYDHTSVARWIRHRAVPRGHVPEVICDLLSRRIGRTLAVDDIGMEPARADPTDELDTTVRRAAATWRRDARAVARVADSAPLTDSSAVAPVFEWENPPDDRDVSHRGHGVIGVSDVEWLKAARQHYEEMYRRVGGIPVRPRLTRLLTDQVTPLLSASYSDATGRYLYRTVGSLTALAGICAYDASHQPLARRYFLSALRMAKASGDRAFGAYIVALLANQAMAAAQYRRVVQFCESAARAAGDALTPALASDLYTMQARAYARMSDKQSCQSLMSRAEAMAGRIRPREEPAETSYVQPGLVETQHAEALRQLADLTAAEEYAAEAVRTVDQAHLRGQVHRYAGLALVRVQQGRVDEALEPAYHMLERFRGIESGRLHDRLRSVRLALTSRSTTPEIGAFAEHVDAELNLGV
ncbi:transcriptional regulator [Lipingzhangella sp. LS1_29]|uniref:Transcriptional regulator n=1 Tax=Lipingzhangella rawalii TaxID=2055835 RepID=A0ABU2H351_9ACTN|nr:transcriptional regulator [Lipingzhangella rawalii]MDS1269274.1 transcriptional regulator [Lipingzhangella rawalii]